MTDRLISQLQAPKGQASANVELYLLRGRARRMIVAPSDAGYPYSVLVPVCDLWSCNALAGVMECDDF